jgi:AbrB family looped-hinge helix DNA binding protein
MKKYPKIVQIDKRGQIVIPKDIRSDLGIDEGTGFWVYSVTDEGILLKKVESEPLDKQQKILEELDDKAEKVGIDRKNLKRSVKKYRKTKEGNLELL